MPSEARWSIDSSCSSGSAKVTSHMRSSAVSINADARRAKSAVDGRTAASDSSIAYHGRLTPMHSASSSWDTIRPRLDGKRGYGPSAAACGLIRVRRSLRNVFSRMPSSNWSMVDRCRRYERLQAPSLRPSGCGQDNRRWFCRKLGSRCVRRRLACERRVDLLNDGTNCSSW